MIDDPRTILLRRHRLALWMRPFWVGVCALAVDNVLVLIGSSFLAHALLAGIAVLGALAVRMFFGPTLQETARGLDSVAHMRNRFEAIALLEGTGHPLARALNDETGDFLYRRPLPPAYLTIAGVTLMVAFAVMRLAMLKPAVISPESRKVAAAPVYENHAPPPTPMPLAALSWLEPASSIVATLGEMVPLLAKSNSSVALKNVKLHVVVVGESQTLSDLGPVAPGEQKIQSVLDLGKLNCAPYSFVGYYLTAELSREGVTASTPPWPELVSPLQLIQIRPVGSNLTAGPPPADEAASSELERMLYAIKRAKAAQIEMVATTFELAHGQPPQTDPTWRTKLKEAVAQERGIWQDTKGLLPAVKADLRLLSAIDLLYQASSELEKTWDALSRANPAPAVDSSQQALAKISEVEQVFSKALAEQQAAKNIALNREVAADGVLRLPPREKTPAGVLERSAREQQMLAEALAKRTSVVSDAFSKEKDIVRDLAKLAANEGFSTDIRSLISSAVVDAREARQHLNDRDQRAAAEPAARAAQSLQSALAAMESSGRERAAKQLAKAQRELNEAALAEKDGDTAAADLAQEKTGSNVAEEALAQQMHGSADAAKQLADLHTAMEEAQKNKKMQSAESQNRVPGQKLAELAEQAAEKRQQVLSDKEREKEQENAVEELRRARSNVKRSAQKSAKALEDLFMQAQENAQKSGQSLNMPPPKEPAPPPEQSASKTEKIKSAAAGGQQPDPAALPLNVYERAKDERGGKPTPSTVNMDRYADGLISEIDRVVALVGAQKRDVERTQMLSTAAVADAPEPYRKAVGDYFEALAHTEQAEASQPSAAKP